jgi:hypothetical protein
VPLVVYDTIDGVEISLTPEYDDEIENVKDKVSENLFNILKEWHKKGYHRIHFDPDCLMVVGLEVYEDVKWGYDEFA